MIEIPKYTVGTYDPFAPEENRRTDFTRRIPTGLSDRQMARDSRIAMQLVRIQQEGGDRAKDRILDTFFHKARLLSNPRYWELMRTVWIAAGSTETAPLFRRMMRSPRPCQSWFMTPEDAEELDAMAFPIQVWRAYDKKYFCTGEADPGISWTTDEKWCYEYAFSKDRLVKTRMVERDDIFAYVTRRGESEVIIL